MTTTSIKLSPSKTRKMLKGFTDNLLRQEVELCQHCRAGGSHMHPNCECEWDAPYKPFDEQPLAALYSSESIHVYIAKAMLSGDPCYAIQKDLNKHFDCGDAILVEEGFDHDFNVRVAFDPCVADHVFPCELAIYREEIRGEIQEEVGRILTNMKLVAMYDQVLEEATA